jgi:predicted Holliday junction resolvase-like endonuclease
MLAELLIAIFAGLFLYQAYTNNRLKHEFLRREDEIRKDAIQRSRDVLEGKIYEQLAPLFPSWVFDPSDAKFLGMPIDYVVFSGLAKGEPTEIVFIEVKTGKSQLSKHQRQLKKLVSEGKVRFELIRLGDK